MPRLYNLRYDRDIPPAAARIDRKTRYGNRFVMGPDGDRAEVIRRFEAEQLPDMDVEPLRGRDLVCWCEPEDCHGRSIFFKLYGTRRPEDA